MKYEVFQDTSREPGKDSLCLKNEWMSRKFCQREDSGLKLKFLVVGIKRVKNLLIMPIIFCQDKVTIYIEGCIPSILLVFWNEYLMWTRPPLQRFFPVDIAELPGPSRAEWPLSNAFPELLLKE